MTTTITAPARPLIAAKPRQGHLVHAVVDQPEWRAQMGLGRLVIYARPLCRPSGTSTTLLIVGGHESPTPVDEALAASRFPCPCCVRIVKQAQGQS